MLFSKSNTRARLSRPKNAKSAGIANLIKGRNRLGSINIEPLEERVLLTVDLTGTPFWFEQGPGPIAVSANFDQVGAIQSLATDPLSTKAFIGSVNGGVWRTNDITASPPSWEPLTDQFQTLSISDIQFSPLDATRQTLFAGTGTSSAGFGDGGAQAGILRSIDNGATWAQIGKTELGGDRVFSVVPTTLIDPVTLKQVVLVAAAGPTGGVWRSTDFGETFTLISNNGAAGNQLPVGNATSIVADPSNASRFYAAVAGQGVFRSIDGGLTWIKRDTGITGNTNGNFRTELQIHNSPGNNVIYAAVFAERRAAGRWSAESLVRRVSQHRSGNTWRQIQPDSGQPRRASRRTLCADCTPDKHDVFFIGGDNFANPSRLRVTVNDGNPALDTWTSVIVDGNANDARPHADARHFAYDTLGNLYETDDSSISA